MAAREAAHWCGSCPEESTKCTQMTYVVDDGLVGKTSDCYGPGSNPGGVRPTFNVNVGKCFSCDPGLGAQGVPHLVA
jgi:hypothetical protein